MMIRKMNEPTTIKAFSNSGADVFKGDPGAKSSNLEKNLPRSSSENRSALFELIQIRRENVGRSLDIFCSGLSSV